MTRIHRLESSEFGSTGWISMCDVYLLSSVLAFSLCFAVSKVAQRLGLENREGNRLVAATTSERDAIHDELSAALETIDNVECMLAEAEITRVAEETREAEASEALENCSRRLLEERGELPLAAEARVVEVREALENCSRRIMEVRSALSAEVESRLVDAHKELETCNRLLEARTELSTEAEALVIETRGELETCSRRLFEAQSDLPVSDPEPQQDDENSEQLSREGQVRQELLGIKGSLNRVIFVVDRSGSMGDGGRWDDAKNTMQTWLRHLPVKEAALVVFGNDVTAFPLGGGLLPTDEVGRGQLERTLADLKPWGGTNALDAFRVAYAYPEIDAFIFFTDGQPDSVSDVLNLVRDERIKRPNLRIHTIGLGDYFSSSMRDFLLTLARDTDGSFLGR